MALSEKDRRALVWGGLALGLIAAYFLAIEPLANAYDRLVTDHDRFAAQVARVMLANRKTEYFAERITEYEQTSGALSPPKPYDEQVTTVGERIVMAAQQSGIQLQGFAPAAATPWADDSAMEMALFHIDAETKWPNVMKSDTKWENVFKFIAGLYRIPGVLSVERLDLSSVQQKKGSGGRLTVRLTLSVLAAASPKSDDLWAK